MHPALEVVPSLGPHLPLLCIKQEPEDVEEEQEAGQLPGALSTLEPMPTGGTTGQGTSGGQPSSQQEAETSLEQPTPKDVSTLTLLVGNPVPLVICRDATSWCVRRCITPVFFCFQTHGLNALEGTLGEEATQPEEVLKEEAVGTGEEMVWDAEGDQEPMTEEQVSFTSSIIFWTLPPHSTVEGGVAVLTGVRRCTPLTSGLVYYRKSDWSSRRRPLTSGSPR